MPGISASNTLNMIRETVSGLLIKGEKNAPMLILNLKLAQRYVCPSPACGITSDLTGAVSQSSRMARSSTRGLGRGERAWGFNFYHDRSYARLPISPDPGYARVAPRSRQFPPVAAEWDCLCSSARRQRPAPWHDRLPPGFPAAPPRRPDWRPLAPARR